MPKSYRSKYQRRNFILSGLAIVGIVAVSAIVLAGVFLVQRSQDIRQQAAEVESTPKPPEFFLPGGDSASPSPAASPESEVQRQPPATPEGIFTEASPSPEATTDPSAIGGIQTSPEPVLTDPSPSPTPPLRTLPTPLPLPIETAPSPSPSPIQIANIDPTPKPVETAPSPTPSPGSEIGGLKASPTPLPVETAPSPSPSPRVLPTPSCTPVPTNCIDINTGQITCDLDRNLLYCGLRASPTPLPIETAPSPSPRVLPSPSCTPVPAECIDILTGRITCTLDRNFLYCGLRASPTPEPSEAPVPGEIERFNRADINRDGRVDLVDYALLSQRFLKPIELLRADINLDGRVDIFDYAILSQEFRLF